MNTKTEVDEVAEPTAKVKSVAATILDEFFDALDEEEELGEVTPKLRKVVLDEGMFAEPSIRAAIFPDAS